jgi:outer membrane protein OmpA-like peptidoglycan-associated protein
MKKHSTLLAAATLVLVGCSTPPKPPVVDGESSYAVNSPVMQELIATRTRMAQLEEKLREEKRRPVISANILADTKPTSFKQNIYFPHNDANLVISKGETKLILDTLGRAKHIEVRGRTDGEHPTVYDEKLALNRALAAKRWLVGKGVPENTISVNYLSSGDYISDNHTKDGKGLNRRVEIEVFF